jgi:hypothetical protein
MAKDGSNRLRNLVSCSVFEETSFVVKQNMIWVAYNHNGREICRNADLGNLMEEVMFYEEVTGNKCSVEQISG